MNIKNHSLNTYVQGLFTILYMLGFLFLCTVVYFNKFEFVDPSDSKQYALPFLIMSISWIFICLTDSIDILWLKKPYASFRVFFAHHILYILFLGGNYLWSKGVKLFMLNHMIIFGIGITTFYKCIQSIRIHIEDKPDSYDLNLIQERNKSS